MGKAKCPICGVGMIDAPKRGDIDQARTKRIMARALHEKGYSLRQIAKLVGWKSVRSASIAIESDD